MTLLPYRKAAVNWPFTESLLLLGQCKDFVGAVRDGDPISLYVLVEITETSAPVSISKLIGVSLTNIVIDHGVSSPRVMTPTNVFVSVSELDSESELVCSSFTDLQTELKRPFFLHL